MRSFRATPSAGRFATALLLSTAAACATSSTRVHDRDRIGAMLDSLTSPEVAGTPGVRISTEDDVGRSNRIITRLRVEESAYVAVVNVSPGGYATVMFPEQPDEPALLAGGKTYVMPSHFTGYHWASVPPAGALGTRLVWYGRSSNARLSAQGPGYIFVIASRSPLNLEALALEGYFDGVELGTSLTDLDPETVVPKVAMVALEGVRRGGVSVDYARYSGYDPAAYVASAFRSSYNTAYCGSGFDVGRTYSPGLLNQWNLDYLRGGCSPLEQWRYRRGPLVQAPSFPVSPPTKPVPPDSAGSAPRDTGTVARPTPRPQPPQVPDTVRPATSSGRRHIVSSSGSDNPAPRAERLTKQRDEVMLTHTERQRAVRNARERLRAGLGNDEMRPRTRPRAGDGDDDPRTRVRTRADRSDTGDRSGPTTGSSGAIPSAPPRTTQPPRVEPASRAEPAPPRTEPAPRPQPVEPTGETRPQPVPTAGMP